MNNHYAAATRRWVSEYTPTLTLAQWLRRLDFESASDMVNAASTNSPTEYERNAAVWLWYMAARRAGDRLTFNAAEMPEVGINTWKRAASIAPGLIHPDVYSLCQPYQLVIA